jgi:hypothetical protein
MPAVTARGRRVRCLLAAVTASAALHAGLIAALSGVCWREPAAVKERRDDAAAYATLLIKARESDGLRGAREPGPLESTVVFNASPPAADESEPPPTPVLGGPRPTPASTGTAPRTDAGNASAAKTGSTGDGPGVGGNAGGHGGGGWFAGAASARSVVFVLDRSLSMGDFDRLKRARREVSAALRALPPSAAFQVIVYNGQAEPLLRTEDRRSLLPATPDLVACAAAALERLPASGGTDHARALHCALALQPRPELLILVTDAADLSPKDLEEVKRFNAGRTAIHVVEVGAGTPAAGERLARNNHGAYKRVTP